MAKRPIRQVSQVQRVFEARSSDMLASMKRRPVVIKNQMLIPFSLVELRVWILELFKGNIESIVECAYCSKPLNIQTLSLDHQTPISPPWWGSLALDNLAPSCSVCNSRKGKMSAKGYLGLVFFAEHELDPRDMTDLFSRLAQGSGYMKQRMDVLRLRGERDAAFGRTFTPKIEKGLFDV